MRSIIVIALVLGGWNRAAAQTEQQEDVPPPASEASTSQTALALARALDARLTVWSSGGRRVYVHHCRRAQVSCRARVVALARVLAQIGTDRGVDPFLLAAMALRESGLNPFAEGSAGERGIVQLHPRGVGSRVRFVQSEGYRARCARTPTACQEEVVDAGAQLMANAMTRCGTVADALGAYNSGVCQTTAYSRRVLEEREQLLTLAKAGVSARDARLVD
ncbi:MAG: transglycosylase SLT domain-containing protein [Myxococcales bacterium]|nr:transglycosylase SLT domain-containing protein [Myxococcales bacterium]